MPSASHPIQGREVTMPVVVRDASSANAMFMVDAGAAQALLPGDAFEVVEVAPGQAQVIVGAIDYRDNDLGDYDEVAVIFFVRPKGRPDADPGTFIYALPVNQSFTCEAGCRIWGFPKSVERIDLETREGRSVCRLEMDGQHVLTLSVRTDGTPAPPSGDGAGCTYTLIDGLAHRTPMRTGGETLLTPGPDGAELTLGSHPLADALRRLGLPKPALLSTYTAHMQGSFENPEKL